MTWWTREAKRAGILKSAILHALVVISIARHCSHIKSRTQAKQLF